MNKPYLFIDVDGVLNPDVRSNNHQTYRILGYIVYLDKNDGKRLLELEEYYELVWATTWMDLANKHIGPKIGLPELPVLYWSDKSPTIRIYPERIMVKTKDILHFVGDRPFAWIDDDILAQDLSYLRFGPDHLALRIDAAHGIRDTDFQELARFGREQYVSRQTNEL